MRAAIPQTKKCSRRARHRRRARRRRRSLLQRGVHRGADALKRAQEAVDAARLSPGAQRRARRRERAQNAAKDAVEKQGDGPSRRRSRAAPTPRSRSSTRARSSAPPKPRAVPRAAPADPSQRSRPRKRTCKKRAQRSTSGDYLSAIEPLHTSMQRLNQSDGARRPAARAWRQRRRRALEKRSVRDGRVHRSRNATRLRTSTSAHPVR